jgi:hypothetical protein
MTIDNLIYGRFDADNVGDKLELLLIRGKVEEARKLQADVQSVIKWLVLTLNAEEGFEILYVGCDDVLFRAKAANYNRCRLDQIRKRFEELCGCTLSCGIGLDLTTALHNLCIAKLEGKDRVVESIEQSVSRVP